MKNLIKFTENYILYVSELRPYEEAVIDENKILDSLNDASNGKD